MIRVASQPEPSGFDASVRQPGLTWLKQHRVELSKRVPAQTSLPAYWRRCLGDLHSSYGGVCAYLCVFVERCTGATSVDHFVAKSRRAGLAYEWSNYRLACLMMNARKREFSTVLDPFSLAPETFYLELVTGRIYPNPNVSRSARMKAQQTIDRLGLDDGGCREMRARHFADYLDARGSTRNPALEARLRQYAPFLWFEAVRQGLL